MTTAARVAVAAALVLAGSLVMLWAGTRPLELLAGTARLLVMAAAVAAVVLALSALWPENERGGNR